MKLNEEALFQQGIAHFNSEEFFEAHESWEKIWLQDQSGDRSFYQGLIQIAGGFHHVQKGRIDPARKALEKGIHKLERFQEIHGGIALDELLTEARKWKASLDLGQRHLEFPRVKKSPPLRGGDGQ